MGEKMKVLWLVNVVFPEVCHFFGLPATVIGGWLSSYRKAIKRLCPDIKLYVISPYHGNCSSKVEYEGDEFYVFPEQMKGSELEHYFSLLYREIAPDIVHLHGTEWPHFMSFVNACGNERTLVSIQGLASVCSCYYFAGVRTSAWLKNITLKDILKFDSIYQRFEKFKRRGESELELLKSVKFIAGRTSWDKANTLAINHELTYFHLDEALRASFYENRWTIGTCKRHSIFLSQVYMPLKGLHVFLEALHYVLRKFPDTEVFLCGEDYSLKPWYRRDGYWNIIRNIIDRYNLRGHLHFLGSLDEMQMVEQFLSANVFVCPSSIENSSNSVCEAQLLGTPVVASYVGGMMDLVEDGKTGLLYRFEESPMLAGKICDIFENDRLAVSLSDNSVVVARRRHDRDAIARRMLEIYGEVMK